MILVCIYVGRGGEWSLPSSIDLIQISRWWWCLVLSHVWLFATPWTVACQALLSMWFPRQEYRSGLPFPSPEDRPNPGTEPMSPALAGGIFTDWITREAPSISIPDLYFEFPHLPAETLPSSLQATVPGLLGAGQMTRDQSCLPNQICFPRAGRPPQLITGTFGKPLGVTRSWP